MQENYMGVEHKTVPGFNPRIREIPDHATFREKVHVLSWLDELGGSLSLALCNQANFDQVWLSKLKDFHQFLICRKFYGTMASPGINSLELHLFYIFLIYI